MMLCKCR